MFAQLSLLSLLCALSLAQQNAYTPLPLQNPSDNSLEKSESGVYPSYVHEQSNSGLEQGYTVQTGYEGYLIPYEDLEPALTLLETKGFLAAALKLVHTVPKLALKLIFKAVPHVLFVGGVILVGGALTTAVCTFTSLCSAGYLPQLFHRIDKEQVRSLGALVSEDKLNAASHYVKTAIENYYRNNGLVKKTARSKKH